MGKTQSKRSVDITTEVKKGAEEEITGKLEKIEDVDQKQVNGDASPQENIEAAEKKDADESENDKDLTTEKSAAEVAQGSSGEIVEDQNITATATVAAELSPNEGGDTATATTKEGTAEDISPLADESIKKSKKEKVKKKWSFRSISFGKKDKQKPAKTEEAIENAAAATNGEAEKSSTADGATTEETKNIDDAAGGDVAAKTSSETVENGATEKELNGQKTPTPTEDKSAEFVLNETTATNTTAAASPATVPTASNEETAIETQTENKATVISAVENVEAAAKAIVSNGDAEKNGAQAAAVADASNEVVTDKAEPVDVVAPTIENNKTIPSVINDGSGIDGDKPHQNGTNAADDADEEAEAEAIAAVVELSKSKIEVNINTTDITPAANLATSSYSTSSSTVEHPNVQSNLNSNSNLNQASNSIEIAAAAQSEEHLEDKENAVVVVDVCSAIASSGADIPTPAEAQCEQSQPPPLPVSPPPSQVSVFAFNNESVETTEISTEQQQQQEEVLVMNAATPPPTPTISPPTPTTPTPMQIITHQTETETFDCQETKAFTEKDLENILEAVPASQDDIEPIVMTKTDQEQEDVENSIAISNLPPAAIVEEHSSFAEEEKIVNELTVATAIVHEVTEKAIEIIQQQQLQKEPLISDEVNKEASDEQQMEEVEPVEVIVAKIPPTDVSNIAENDNETTTTVAPATAVEILIDTKPAVVVKKEIFISAASFEIPQTTTTHIVNEEDCSLIAKNQIENLALMNRDDDAVTFSSPDSVSLTKEIANAKDLKENTAAEITTQDLPVTCE